MLPLNKKLLSKIVDLIELKQSNLVLSADLNNYLEVLNLVKLLYNKIIAVKIHSDIVDNFCQDFIFELVGMSEEYKFLIIEDRKFCDIGNTVFNQSKNITKYAHLITCHGISGPGILEGLKENCVKNECGVLLIASMSSKDNLIDSNYTKNIVDMAKDSDIVVGFITQEFLHPDFLHFSPGVNITNKADKLQQNYNSPEFLIREKNTDILIVGRGLYQQNHDSNDYIHLNLPRLKYLKNSINKTLLENNSIIQRGNFTLSSGKKATTYFNFKNLVSRPKLLNYLAQQLYLKLVSNGISCQDYIITGVPMGGIPLAVTLSSMYLVPMIILRDNKKSYGLENIVEGEINGKSCIVIEDVVSTGQSLQTFCDSLIKNGIVIKAVICVLDRDLIEKVIKIPYISLFKESDFL